MKTNNEAYCRKALQGLYEVDDPEIGLNIVDLGLVYELYFDQEVKKIRCMMTLTTQFCPMGDVITADTFDSLSTSFPSWEVKVDLTFDPVWNLSMVSPVGLEFLGR